MKATVVALALAAMASAALAADRCPKPQKESWIAEDGHSYVAAMIHLPCEGWGAGPAPKGSWVETRDADTIRPQHWLHIGWDDAVKAGIVEEKARRTKVAKKCLPELRFKYKNGKPGSDFFGVWYPCGMPGHPGYPANKNPEPAFGSQGFEYSPPDLTGRSRIRDKATGKTLICSGGNCY